MQYDSDKEALSQEVSKYRRGSEFLILGYTCFMKLEVVADNV